MEKLGIFGGTFDPIHVGHLLVAETALQQLGLNRILWVPTSASPHKSPSSSLPLVHRLEMVRLAIADHPAFQLCDPEGLEARSSYAIDTLEALQIVYPPVQWHWVVGLDTFQTLPHWYRSHDLATQCTWIVAPRGHWAELEIDWICQQVALEMANRGLPFAWQSLSMPWVAISSSLVRQYCREQRSIRYLVSDSVRAYIATHELYSIH